MSTFAHLSWGVVLLVLATVCARAELTLVVRHGGEDLTVARVEGGVILASKEGRDLPIPEGAEFRLEGDLRANAAAALWSPSYGISVPDTPDIARREAKARASTGLRHVRSWMSKKLKSDMLELWPQTGMKPGVMVGAWVVDGSVTQVRVDPVPGATKEHSFAVHLKFELSAEETRGQAILLFWSEGQFRPPAPRFEQASLNEAFHALVLGDSERFGMALAAVKDVNTPGTGRCSLLHFAAETGNIPAMDALLARRAKVNAETSGGSTPLHWAAGKGRGAAIERLLMAKARIDATTDGGVTPLLSAINAGHVEVARILLDAGADPEAVTTDHRSPFTAAIDHGFAELAQAMSRTVSKRALDSEQLERVFVTQAAKGHTAMLRFLLSRGVKGKLLAGGQTALIAGARTGDAEMAKLLLAGKMPVNEKGAGGATALFEACRAGSVAYARVLLYAGADPNVVTERGHTCLHVAAVRNSAELVAMLLDGGADLNAVDQTGYRPLDMALEASARDAAKVLAARGARVDIGAEKHNRHLHIAVQFDLADVVAAALADGWKPEEGIHEQWNALRVAEFFEARESAALLRTAGLSFEAADVAPVVPVRDLDARPKLRMVVTPEDPRDIDSVYPAATVLLDALVLPDGQIFLPKIQSTPDPILGFSVLVAVARWKFEAITSEGLPVCARIRIPIQFPSSEDAACDASRVDELPEGISLESPKYPYAQRSGGDQGRVNVRFTVGVDGTVRDIRTIGSTDPAFEAAAVNAMMKWRFRPGQLNGKPVSTRLEQPIVFSLTD